MGGHDLFEAARFASHVPLFPGPAPELRGHDTK